MLDVIKNEKKKKTFHITSAECFGIIKCLMSYKQPYTFNNFYHVVSILPDMPSSYSLP